jgi:hypothetical protein
VPDSLDFARQAVFWVTDPEDFLDLLTDRKCNLGLWSLYLNLNFPVVFGDTALWVLPWLLVKGKCGGM